MDSRSSDEADLARLLEELENSDGTIRERAALAVSKVNLEPMTAVAIYLRLLADSESEIRGIAATALGSLGPLATESVPYLRRMMQDDWSGEVCIAAAKALWKIDDRTTEEAIQLLTPVVMNLDSSERREAAAALSEIGLPAKTAIDGLVEQLVVSFESGDVTDGCFWALEIIWLLQDLGGCTVEQLRRLIAVDENFEHLEIAMNLVEHRPSIPTEFILHFMEHTNDDDAHLHLLRILEGRTDWTTEQALPAFKQAIRRTIGHPMEPDNSFSCIQLLDQRSDCTAEQLILLFEEHYFEIHNEWFILDAIEPRLATYPSSRLAELLTEIQCPQVRAILDRELKKRDAPAVSVDDG